MEYWGSNPGPHIHESCECATSLAPGHTVVPGRGQASRKEKTPKGYG